MKLRAIYIAFATGAALSLSAGCSFLEEKSWDEVIPKTTNDFAELLVGSAYPSADPNVGEPFSFTSLMDDDVTLLSYAYPYQIDQIAASGVGPIYTWQSSVGLDTRVTGTLFYHYYKMIMGCNAVLDLIDDAVGSQAERDRVKAEALALRAYYYWVLVNFYGEPYGHNPDAPGVSLKLDSKVINEYPARNTVREVYARISADLTEAVRLLEPLPVTRLDYRVNRPAINILFARVLLHMEDWEGVVEQATMAYEGTEGSMLLDMSNMGMATNDNRYYLDYSKNREIEWAFGALPYYNQWTSLFSFNQTRVLELFGADDARWKYGFEYQFVEKFATLTSSTEPKQSFRMAEAVISRAEAYAQLGEQDKATADYNLLRDHRVTGHRQAHETFDNKEELLLAIRDERRREFMFEGFRWFDLRRYGMPEIVHVFAVEPGQPQYYVLEKNDPMYTLPLENELLLRNANLVQNPSGSMPGRVPSDIVK